MENNILDDSAKRTQTPDEQIKASAGRAFYVGRGVERTVMISHAEGVYFWDTDGKRYLDGSSGAVCSNIGHGNERVKAAIVDQISKCNYIVRTAFTTEATEKLCALVADLAGTGFDQTFLCSGGSEAVEAALKLARQYAYVKGEKSRWKVLGRLPGFHGSTTGATSVGGDPDRDEVFGPTMLVMPKVPAPLSYRVPEGYDRESYADHCADCLEQQILTEGPETVLGFIMEPVGGVSSGGLVAPDSYYRKVREICDRYGVLLIFDEVMSGAGRTGKFLAAHHWPDARPDLVACAKGLSAGYAPLGAMLAPSYMVDAVVKSGGFMHGHTYSGNPLSSAVGVAVLNELIDRDLMINARKMGELLRARLNELKETSPVIGDVRGLGLLNAVEIVSDKATKEVFPGEIQATYRLSQIARDLGLHIYARRAAGGKFGEWFLASPPLTINEQELDEFMDLLTKAIKIFEKEVGKG